MPSTSTQRPARSGELVVTLGPASFDLAARLTNAGASALRLNGSHMSAAELAAVMQQVRLALPTVPLVVDLQGAKMRVGAFPNRSFEPGELASFGVPAEGCDGDAVPVPHPELFRAARVGDTLRCDDDRLRFEVTAVEHEQLEARCLLGGTLRQRKAINLLEHPVALEDLGERDREQIRAALSYSRIGFALSFMTDGREADWVRRRAPGRRIIGKVERRAALDHLQELATAVDELWICRGDLGAQLGLAALASFVATFDPRSVPVPVLMAGQVLEHLTSHDSPTRSELCHLHDLLVRGYAGIVLSDETAIGAKPLQAARVASELLGCLGHG